MRKLMFLLTCLLITVVVNASQVNYHQTKQLQTHETVFTTPQFIAPVYISEVKSTQSGLYVLQTYKTTDIVQNCQMDILQFKYPQYGLCNRINYKYIDLKLQATTIQSIACNLSYSIKQACNCNRKFPPNYRSIEFGCNVRNIV